MYKSTLKKHGQSGQDTKNSYQREPVCAAKVIFKIVNNRGASNHIERKIKQIQQKQNPCLAGQPLKILLKGGVLLAYGWRNNLLGACKGEKENAHSRNSIEGHCDKITASLIAASEKIYQGRSDGHYDCSSDHSADHSC